MHALRTDMPSVRGWQLPSVDVAENKIDAELRDLFMRHGRQSSAYFIFQDGVSRFIGTQGGMLHYVCQHTPFGDVNLVFCNPLCDDHRMPFLLREFVASSDLPSVFVAVDHRVSEPLKQLGFSVNQIGSENRIPLEKFSLKGKKKKQLRHASNFGRRTGAVVKELDWSQVDADEVKRISRRWRQQKAIKSRELRYATRPPCFGDEWGVRKFFCCQGDELLGYVFFDPYYDAGEIKGYCANILRARPEQDIGAVLDFVILEAMKIFQAEGVDELSLGVSPLAGIYPEAGERRLIRWISEAIYRYGNKFYSFRGLQYHKSRYRPIETPWYLCTRDIGLPRLYYSLLFGLNAVGPLRPKRKK